MVTLPLLHLLRKCQKMLRQSHCDTSFLICMHVAFAHNVVPYMNLNVCVYSSCRTASQPYTAAGKALTFISEFWVMVTLCMLMYTYDGVRANLEVIVNRLSPKISVCDHIKLRLNKRNENAFYQIKCAEVHIR